MSNKGQQSSRNGRGHPYVAVRVILICWDNEKKFKDELEKLRDELSPHFPTWKWTLVEIPKGRDDMTDYVKDFVHRFAMPENNINELLIVMYSGHGALQIDPATNGASSSSAKTHGKSKAGATTNVISPAFTRLFWWRNSLPTQKVDWSSVQNQVLFVADKDTAVFLDCCYASGAFRPGGESQKYILAASADVTPQLLGAMPPPMTLPDGERSFTSFLRRAALSFNQAFTVDQLRLRIIQLRFEMMPVYENRPEPPNHPIVLAPSLIIPSGSRQIRQQSIQSSSNEVQTQWGWPKWPGWPEHIDVEVTIVGVTIRIRIWFKKKGKTNITDANLLALGIQADQLLECEVPGDNRVYQREDREFFSHGKVFAIPWSDQLELPGQPITGWPYRETGQQERLFIVVGQSGCTCSVVEVHKSQTQAAQRYATMFTGKSPPRGADKNAVRIRCDRSDSRLDPGSYVDLGSVHRVSFSVPVRNVGSIHESYTQNLVQSFGLVARSTSSAKSARASSSTPEITPTNESSSGQSQSQVMRPVQVATSTSRTAVATGAPREAVTNSAAIQANARAAVERLMRQGYTQEQAVRAVQDAVRKQQQQRLGPSRDNDSDEEDEEEDDDDDDDDEDEDDEFEDSYEDLSRRTQNLSLQRREQR